MNSTIELKNLGIFIIRLFFQFREAEERKRNNNIFYMGSKVSFRFPKIDVDSVKAVQNQQADEKYRKLK